MSGHSKWNTIKRKKGKTDALRGKMFTKVTREIATAAKQGGGDPEMNSRLRLAIEKAREVNMPQDNVKRAIAKGAGGGEGVNIEELTYEGYGPQGVAIIVDTITDNKNRTLGEIRNLFSKNGGNLGETGCVSWIFEKRGLITYERGKVDENKLAETAIDAGAIDINLEESIIEVITAPGSFEKVRDTLKEKGFKFETAEVTMFPKNTVKLTGEDAHKALKLVSILEDNDDVQAVHANFDIPDEIIEKEIQS
ncbi:MAG: YebC/PmpR family DNA-binding transcriptional regulator [Candidatus Saganbacteria bacterium]|nr:YebC/PmpR family DNA-binding transcriptional regulator [Candidatus Saganbacteria bacterium]